VAIAGIDLGEILCVQEEREVGNDNCVSFNRLKLQFPASPLRAHSVKAQVKVRQYYDGTYAIFHGPRCLGRYDRKGHAVDIINCRLNPLGGEPVDGMDKSPTCPPRPQENKKQKKRTFDVLPKPAKLIRYRHVCYCESVTVRGCGCRPDDGAIRNSDISERFFEFYNCLLRRTGSRSIVRSRLKRRLDDFR
jgi:hypothetical protein